LASGELNDLVFQDPSKVDKRINDLVLSTDKSDALKEVFKYSLFDKTYLLIFVFCIIWQSPSADGGVLSNNRNHIQGLRIFIASSVGIIFMNVEVVTYQKNLFRFQTGMMVAFVLIISLVVYMYNICHSYLSNMIEDEKQALTDLNSMRLSKVSSNINNTNDIIKNIKDDCKRMQTIRKDQEDIICNDSHLDVKDFITTNKIDV
jgi:hypothetical protein